MKKFLIIAFFFASLLVLAACSGQTNNVKGDDGKIFVVTTISQIADGVKNIGGDKVEVQSLMGPGTDPHLYKATQSDLSKMEKANIIFYNGLYLEGKMLDVLEKMKKEKPVYGIAEGIDETFLLGDEETNAPDPHIWFDIDLWKQALEKVKEGLIELDEENKEFYENNAEEYFKELDALKQYAEEKLHAIHEDKRVLVTAHDAFGYFGNAYNMEVIGLQGLSTDSEYGLSDVQKLIDLLVSRDIKAVFIESTISDRSIKAVIEGAREKGHEVKIGGELFSDAMGEEGTEEGTYIGMYKHNVDAIAEALN